MIEKTFQEWFFKYYAGQYKSEEALSRIHRIAFDAFMAGWAASTNDETFKNVTRDIGDLTN